MSTLRISILSAIVLALLCSTGEAQLQFEQVAKFGLPHERERRFTGGREVEFNQDGTRLIAAFYGSTAQLYDMKDMATIGAPIGTGGDGEVGFVNNEIAYTADWNAMRLWDAQSGQQLGEAIPHELREDTIIHPAIGPHGKKIATRSTMKSVQLWDVRTRKPIGKQLSYSSEVYSIRFSDDGALLFVRASGSLHAIDTKTGERVAGPIKAGWQFYHFPDEHKLLTTEQPEKGLFQLVIRSTNQDGWPETHRSDLPGKLTRVIALDEGRVLLQAANKDYTPALFTFSLDKPEARTEVQSTADRAFGLVVPEDKQHWICNNIRNISCQKFGEPKPLWQIQVPPSGYDHRVFPFNNEHFIIRDKNENFGVYKVSDGSSVWKQLGVKRFALTKNRIAIGNKDGIEVWAFE